MKRSRQYKAACQLNAAFNPWVFQMRNGRWCCMDYDTYAEGATGVDAYRAWLLKTARGATV